MLKRSALALSAALGLLGMSALTTAHAGFVSATPAPGSNLQVAPTEVRVTFGAELDPDGSRINQAVPTTPGGGSSADTSVAPRPTHSWSLLLLGALLLLAGAATLARRLALR